MVRIGKGRAKEMKGFGWLGRLRSILTRAHLLLLLLAAAAIAPAQGKEVDKELLWAKVDRLSQQVEPKCIAWRRDIHQHPELSGKEYRTAQLVAQHLRGLGLEVRTGVAGTGVVGVLKGWRDRPVVALRADMDALPVTEATDLPFASKMKAEYEGKEVGVMHACGHDAHTAILMAVAEVLYQVREDVPGTVKFIFQPAEELGEGAAGMIREGVLDMPSVDAIFGLHVGTYPVGTIWYRPGGYLASADLFSLAVVGSQTHGANPWMGIDPIVIASQIVLGLQTVVSRQVDLTATPAVISIGSIHGGVRFNIIPDRVEMVGTIRAFDRDIQKEIHQRMRRTAEMIAESAGARAEVKIESKVPVAYNDPDLTRRMLPTLERVVGEGRLLVGPQTTGSEDFAFFQEKVPGLYFFLGITPEGGKAIPHHSPHFYVDEAALIVGVRALAHLALDFLAD
jgi:amidohydrolase